MQGMKKEPSHSVCQNRSIPFTSYYRCGAWGAPIYKPFSLLPLQESLITFRSDFTVSTGYNLLCALHHFLRVLSSFDFLISLICIKQDLQLLRFYLLKQLMQHINHNSCRVVGINYLLQNGNYLLFEEQHLHLTVSIHSFSYQIANPFGDGLSRGQTSCSPLGFHGFLQCPLSITQ